MTITAEDHSRTDERARAASADLLKAARAALHSAASALDTYNPADRGPYSLDALDVALSQGDAAVMTIRAYKISTRRL